MKISVLLAAIALVGCNLPEPVISAQQAAALQVKDEIVWASADIYHLGGDHVHKFYDDKEHVVCYVAEASTSQNSNVSIYCLRNVN